VAEAGRPRPKRGNRRTRKLWIAVGATLGGLLGLSALGYWIDQRRETDLQDPTAGVTATSLEAVPSTDAPRPHFHDEAVERGLEMRHGPGPRGRTLPEDTGSGLAWLDYDGDGDDDLYVVNYPGPLGTAANSAGRNHLFRNDSGQFTELGEAAGVDDAGGFGMGASAADYDGDGWVDLYVTNRGPNRLFHNLGDGTFEDVAAELGVDDELWSVAAAWGDVDRDGRLDLYVTNYVEFIPALAGEVGGGDPEWQGVPFTLNPNAFDPLPNRLYHQTSDGAFEEVALELGVSNPGGRSLAATFVDLDGDGWLDLYVANDVSPNALFHNLAGELGGEAVFEDWSAMTGTADPRGSMGISVADLPETGAEPDGLPDLFITHWVAQENALYRAVSTTAHRLEYRDKVRELRLAEISTDKVGWGSAFLDFDLDGRLDLVVANGSTLEMEGDAHPDAGRKLQAQSLNLFWNSGERFYDLAPMAGEVFERDHVARGLATADFDLDGDPDLAISINRGRPLLLRNGLDPALEEGTGWLAVRPNAAGARAFGAQVEVVAGHRQIRWFGADVSFASAHAPELLFGLGPRERVSVVAIRNAHGRRLELRNLLACHRLVISEAL